MGLVLLRKGSQCLQILALPDLNNYCNNICSCLSTELYVANKDIVTSRFSSIYFTVILAGPKKIVRYTDDFVTDRGSLNQGSNQNSYDICISKVENGTDTGLYYTS